MALFGENWRPRRSALFVPASNERALGKAPSLDCDCLLFDLEDSVAPNERTRARGNLSTVERPANTEIVVRISQWGSDEADGDLEAALMCEPDAILLPKLESPDPLFALRERLGTSGPAIWAMIESPAALLDLRYIVGCAKRTGLQCLIVGPNDLAKTTGVRPGTDRAELLPWLMQVVAAARAFGLVALDGVYNDFADADGFARQCEQGARMGFDGKTLIHPAQIDGANAAFLPPEHERERAKAIMAAFELPENDGKGAINMNGEMVERLHLDSARRLLAALDRHNL